MWPIDLYFTIIQLHPLAYCSFALIIGIILSFNYWYLTLAILGIALFILVSRQKPVWAILIVLSCLGGALRLDTIKKHHLNFIETVNNRPCSVFGHVTAIEYPENARAKQKITLSTSQIIFSDQSSIAQNKIIELYLSHSAKLEVDDEIEIAEIIIKKNKNNDFQEYQIKEGVAATVFITDLKYKLIHRPKRSLSRTLFSFKQNLLNRCKQKLSFLTFAFFSSVFLGNKNHGKKRLEESKDNCRTWGISHYLARSGLHMIIFIVIWHYLLNVFQLPFALKQILLVVISLIYYLLSWPSISFIRAFMSFLLFKFCTLFQLASQLFHILTLITIVVLLYNPMQLFFLDFQLSFGLTCALAWFNLIHAQNRSITQKY